MAISGKRYGDHRLERNGHGMALRKKKKKNGNGIGTGGRQFALDTLRDRERMGRNLRVGGHR